MTPSDKQDEFFFRFIRACSSSLAGTVAAKEIAADHGLQEVSQDLLKAECAIKRAVDFVNQQKKRNG